MKEKIFRTTIMNAPIDVVKIDDALDLIKEKIETKSKLHIITINPEMIMLSKDDKEFFNILENSGLLVPDGSGVIWALRRQGIKIPKLAGIELSEKCVRELNAKIFLLGSQEEIIKAAYENLNKISKNNNIVGYRNGFFKEGEEDQIINTINDLNVDILLVGLGVPKQEKWITKNINKINASVFIGVGGSFDVFSGKIKRAPLIMRKLHLEWLYRLYKEPWRWKRMLVLPKFVGEVYRFKDKGNS